MNELVPKSAARPVAAAPGTDVVGIMVRLCHRLKVWKPTMLVAERKVRAIMDRVRIGLSAGGRRFERSVPPDRCRRHINLASLGSDHHHIRLPAPAAGKRPIALGGTSLPTTLFGAGAFRVGGGNG